MKETGIPMKLWSTAPFRPGRAFPQARTLDCSPSSLAARLPLPEPVVPYQTSAALRSQPTGSKKRLPAGAVLSRAQPHNPLLPEQARALLLAGAPRDRRHVDAPRQPRQQDPASRETRCPSVPPTSSAMILDTEAQQRNDAAALVPRSGGTPPTKTSASAPPSGPWKMRMDRRCTRRRPCLTSLPTTHISASSCSAVPCPPAASTSQRCLVAPRARPAWFRGTNAYIPPPALVPPGTPSTGNHCFRPPSPQPIPAGTHRPSKARPEPATKTPPRSNRPVPKRGPGPPMPVHRTRLRSCEQDLCQM